MRIAKSEMSRPESNGDEAEMPMPEEADSDSIGTLESESIIEEEAPKAVTSSKMKTRAMAQAGMGGRHQLTVVGCAKVIEVYLVHMSTLE